MSFVHGHARHSGWVVAHRRAPHRSEAGQLALLPGPRPPPDAEQCDPAPTVRLRRTAAGSSSTGSGRADDRSRATTA